MFDASSEAPWRAAPSRRWLTLLSVTLVLGMAGLAAAAWPQEDGARRDAWQRPADVMDALGIGDAAVVADLGCGEGYFTERLSRRVGPQGTVYAVDVDDDALGKLRERIRRENLQNVKLVRARSDNPMLPENSLDAVLIVNAYHEMREHDAVLRAVCAALRAGGRLGVIDASGEAQDSRERGYSRHTIVESFVRQDAERAGLRFRSKERGFERPNSDRKLWFFLVFEK